MAPTWSNHVVKSCTIANRGDGASVGAGSACVWTSATATSWKKTEKLAVLNICSLIIVAFPSMQLRDSLVTGSMLGHTPGQAAVRVIGKSQGAGQRPSCSARMTRATAKPAGAA